MPERELRSFEVATLGPEHAAEHAQLRKAVRLEKEAGADPVEPPVRRAAASIAAAEDVGQPADVGAWEAVKTKFPIVAIHSALLPTGKIMFFSYPTYPTRPNNAEAYLWDPAKPAQAPVIKNPPGKANIASTRSSRSTPGPRPGKSSRRWPTAAGTRPASACPTARSRSSAGSTSRA
jgi:hypothetical protein